MIGAIAKTLKTMGDFFTKTGKKITPQTIEQKAKMRKTAKKRKTFKEGGLVSGKAQAKKYFKGIF